MTIDCTYHVAQVRLSGREALFFHAVWSWVLSCSLELAFKKDFTGDTECIDLFKQKLVALEFMHLDWTKVQISESWVYSCGMTKRERIGSTIYGMPSFSVSPLRSVGLKVHWRIRVSWWRSWTRLMRICIIIILNCRHQLTFLMSRYNIHIYFAPEV